MSPVEQVPASEWESWVAVNGASVLDVRQPGEWARGTLPGSIRISMAEIPGRLSELPLEQPVLVVCRTGDRSNQVAAFMQMYGYQAANMAGGVVALGMNA